MRHSKTLQIAIAIILTLATPLLADAARPGDIVPGRYIVQLDGAAAPDQVAARHGLAPDRVYKHAVNGFAGFVPPGRLKALSADPAVLSVVPDRVIGIVVSKKPDPVDPPASVQTVPSGVLRIGADPKNVTFTGSGVGIAIVDTGIDLTHLDLQVAEESFSAFIKDGPGQDDHGHGTHVAGIAAALNNTLDVVGVAPGATLYAVKVLDASGSGWDSDIIAGLKWIAENGAGFTPPIQVVNLSLGRPGYLGDSPLLEAAYVALYNANITVVVSAGNNAGLEVSQQVPATYPWVLAVASTTAEQGSSRYRPLPEGIAADTASYFTTDGAFVGGIGVTISAPGEAREDINRAGFIQSVGILSTRLGGGTTRMSGTSMASPHVAGVVARLIEFNDEAPFILEPEVIRFLIRSNADRATTAPLDSPTSAYSFDKEREGIVMVP